MTYNHNRHVAAIALLQSVALHVIEQHNYVIATAPAATNNYSLFKESALDTNTLTISQEGNDTSIYQSPEANITARAWHDINHLILDAPFTTAGEVEVCTLQIEDIRAYALQYDVAISVFKLATKLIEADIAGQVTYYNLHNTFVPHQESFVLNSVYNYD